MGTKRLRVGRRLALGLMAGLLAVSAGAQTVYKSTDASGHTVYTDQPTSGAKPVDIGPVNTTPATAIPPPQPKPTPQFAGYTKIALSAPGSVPNPFIPVQVDITIEPALRSGDSWRLFRDGQQVSSGRGSSYTFSQLDRGLHHVGLSVVDPSGKVLGEASPVDIFVQFVHRKRQ